MQFLHQCIPRVSAKGTHLIFTCTHTHTYPEHLARNCRTQIYRTQRYFVHNRSSSQIQIVYAKLLHRLHIFCSFQPQYKPRISKPQTPTFRYSSVSSIGGASSSAAFVSAAFASAAVACPPSCAIPRTAWFSLRSTAT